MEFSHAFPRKVVFGPNSVNKVPDEVTRLASPKAHVLVVTDKTIAQIGLSNRVVASLKDKGMRSKSIVTLPVSLLSRPRN